MNVDLFNHETMLTVLLFTSQILSEDFHSKAMLNSVWDKHEDFNAGIRLHDISRLPQWSSWPSGCSWIMSCCEARSSFSMLIFGPDTGNLLAIELWYMTKIYSRYRKQYSTFSMNSINQSINCFIQICFMIFCWTYSEFLYLDVIAEGRFANFVEKSVFVWRK